MPFFHRKDGLFFIEAFAGRGEEKTRNRNKEKRPPSPQLLLDHGPAAREAPRSARLTR